MVFLKLIREFKLTYLNLLESIVKTPSNYKINGGVKLKSK
ncbi:hypothetical protein SAMN05216294_1012 [Flagellimonas zhangzhouensis]|uniref:Uncharacterized protein n=1 Tax=Flagellimonas zhangzhouensis TaxID=1073328 RepID=A0A1H2WR09_9FLAO|nr:hypothetical protein SAMN05216294_1012 [Allomuricauda zhangzhouensis]SDW82938.1 hypothetical protein SAMN04487892_2392 [Allomuricauda zhangzhouensis]